MDGEPGHMLEGLLIVEGCGQDPAGLGHDGQALPGPMLGRVQARVFEGGRRAAAEVLGDLQVGPVVVASAPASGPKVMTPIDFSPAW